MRDETAKSVAAGRRRPASAAVLTGLAIALVAAVALVVFPYTAPVEGVQDRAARSRPDPGVTGSGQVARPAGTAASERAAVARDLLAARSAALGSGDAEQWTSTVDPQASDFAARQDALFATLTALPRASWTYTYAGEGPALTPARARDLGGDAFIARVRLGYRLDPADEREVRRDQFLTLARRDGRWLVAGDDDAAGLTRSTQPDPWDLGAVVLARGRSSLVLARPGQVGLSATEITRLADRAVEQVKERWPGPWPQHVVVIVPADVAEMARLIRAGTAAGSASGLDRVAGLAQIAAVTTGQPTGEPGGVTTGNRIVVNPTAFARLTEAGRQVVLTHESTHVATRTLAGGPVPTWLAEGFADYVAFRATDLDVEEVAGDALARIRVDAAPVRLPGEAEFDASRGPVSASYSWAWLAARHIARTHGEAGLVEFYRTAAAGPPGDRAGAAAVAFREVLGTSEAQFVAAWRRSLLDLAPRSGMESER